MTPDDKHVWTKLFVEYFLANAHCTIPHCSAQTDDMLWYVKQRSSFFVGSDVSFRVGTHSLDSPFAQYVVVTLTKTVDEF